MAEAALRKCDVCGQPRVTALVTFKQNVSFFFRRLERKFSGHACLGCMTATFVSYEAATLVGTWWGFIGIILGPFYILGNLFEFLGGGYDIFRDSRKLRARSLASNSNVAMPPHEPGATPASAIRIRAKNSIEGIPKEYAVLEAMFGTRSKDWKLIDRSLIHEDDGRKLEKFIISASSVRKEVYFDVSEMMSGNYEPDARSALQSVIARSDRQLEIMLPREEFMTLQIGILHLSDEQLSQLGLTSGDRKSMLDPLLDALKAWHGKDYADLPDHILVSALASVWTNILGLLTSWKPANLLQEEELENLKAIVGGTLKSRITR